MKNRKLMLFLVPIIVVMLFITGIKADSGWDSSYGGGSSSYSSSSSHSSSSYSSSSSRSSYSSSSDYDGPFWIWFLADILVIGTIVAIINTTRRGNMNNGSTYGAKRIFYDMPDEIAAKYGININDFKIMAYDKYVEIQNAWSDFEYDKLQELLTDELYNSYKMQLDALKLKNQKNVMTDIKYIDAKVYNVKEEGDITTVYTYLNIAMYDYVVDHKNSVVRGNKSHKIDIEYLIEFVKDSSGTVKKCPNCGNEINMTVSGECEYCRSKIVVNPNEYVMSKKENIGQRML